MHSRVKKYIVAARVGNKNMLYEFPTKKAQGSFCAELDKLGIAWVESGSISQSSAMISSSTK